MLNSTKMFPAHLSTITIEIESHVYMSSSGSLLSKL